MKGKLRAIQVDDQTFLWRVVRLSQPNVCLRIWIDGKKASPWVEIIYRFDDPWLNFRESVGLGSETSAQLFQLVPLRPKQIAEIIRKVAERYKSADQAVIHSVYELAGDGNLIAIACK